MSESMLDDADEIVPPEMRDCVERLARAVATLSRHIARGGDAEALDAETGGLNPTGESSRALDLVADATFRHALDGGSVRYLVSEEAEGADEINPAGKLAVAMDPLDGSSNIGVNGPIGAIFSIFPAEATAEASFLRPGREMTGAGYALFGAQCLLVLSFGRGVRKFALDPDSGRFRPAARPLVIAQEAYEYAINAANDRHWDRSVRSWVKDCLAGRDGPRGRDFNTRWVGAIVADTHRILTRGGIYLYPADTRQSCRNGRLRYLYECAPVAFLVEQAGGVATDGKERLLDRTPRTLHERAPLIFGSARTVERVRSYYRFPDSEHVALFGTRGLFRSVP
ncbi:class 1 fructose-bisphosphatase [Acidomonas methanolica]|uniref:Fructose-1,6-bisphosphatase class 1 n=2 Tax=Acidomonas methanolica TaxID=437 RepID=A0A023D639_ACIMT|nr:class 1 fructose-bisphosphatase [Acidomonas methanolica]MBU2655454.1 class 1 fructose-bisphosphatase [Acidomonas methanolica]TCS24440.1 D-fructose 1,6-bisphosphatase [Acidomonas methanolica]BAN85801.1 fructose-1,6-bisphosphatase class 1 [Acidomonas methanolica]GAJ29261.1 fructose 1,6-bisphosphatase class I [Acidomonas methanolica NBRC 104435]GBQ50198.1 fructose-1,6-bisphosphatase [Acidomonas methanolica]